MTTQFGKYQLIEKLGEGRFGEVWRALDTSLEREVALKILKPEWSNDAEFVQLFRKEARTAAQMMHANVVLVFDVGEYDGRWHISMEYCPGGSLAQRLEKAGAGLSVAETLELLAEMAQGLAELHKRQVVHCDLKPANVLLDAQGQAKVGDMGLARSYSTSLSSGSGLGGAQHSPGTPAYMSPEQEDNKAFLRPASDVYSLGLIVYELLTLRNYKLEAPGTRLRDARPDAPEWLDELLEKMLVKDFEKRLWDGGKVLQALRAGLQEHERQAAAVEQERQAASAEKLRQEKEAPQARPAAADKLRKNQEAAEQKRKTEEAEARRKAEVGLVPPTASGDERKQCAGKVELAPGVVMEFVHVPAGEFRMGSNERKNEKPVHIVRLAEYWLGKTPVTNAQYAAFVKASGRTAPEYFYKGQPPKGKENHPVVKVTWEDAAAFCAWASQVSGVNVRLASEAEWEMGALGKDGRKYPWGNEQPDEKRCNFNSVFRGTTPVGKYSPLGDSPYGCVDMAGNVWEWVADWYDEDYYSQSPSLNPPGPEKSSRRVLRGGSSVSDKFILRSAYRENSEPADRNYSTGFRCATSDWS